MKHTLLNRIKVGKFIGFLAGGIVFFGSPFFGIDLDTRFGLGLWMFYITLGAMIGFMGMYDHHPMFKFKMPFWFRGIILGVSMHLLLVLLAYDNILQMMNQMDLSSYSMESPYWALLDGAILGYIMAFFTTKYAGEGKMPLE